MFCYSYLGSLEPVSLLSGHFPAIPVLRYLDYHTCCFIKRRPVEIVKVRVRKDNYLGESRDKAKQIHVFAAGFIRDFNMLKYFPKLQVNGLVGDKSFTDLFKL